MNARLACPPLLAARDLVLRAGPRTLARGLSLEMRPGELWCLLGPNGCGKTTLLATLAGLRPPHAGRIELAGRALERWRAPEAARLRAFLPQAIHDAFSASVLEAVIIGRHPHLARWRWEGEDDRRVALQALGAMDLEGYAGRDVLTLSGGERQRAAIAAVLAQDPPLLLLDEPLAHLDVRHQAAVMRHFASLAGGAGKAIAVSLHDVNVAARFATHALVFLPEGEARRGAAGDVLTAATLSAAFNHRLRSVPIDGRTVFVPE
jgi:iron complex transport system ATP-binding protein